MRRTPPPIHLLAAVDATATTTFVMSSRPLYRGRGRGFSGRFYSGGRGNYVTGDEHFRSVRDANLGHRRGERGSFANQTPPPPPPQQQHYQNPPYNLRPRAPPPHHLQNSQFRHPPPQFRPSPPHVHNRPAFRPPQHQRPRPSDYRHWELAATPPPPSHCERFIVLSYNILAEYLALDHKNKLYFHIPHHMLDWQWRKNSIIFELGLWSADIMCLQEVDRFNDLAEELKLKGYSGTWKMRTGNPVDGCAIFWRTSRFRLLYEECIEFNKLGLRDNVAQICVLEFINQNGSLPSSVTGSSKVVVCNTHVLFNPNRGEIKLGQVRVLLDKAKAVSELWNNAPVVICGDFNCTPKSPLYNFISGQKLDLSGIDRNKVSGQASAVIRAPRINYGPNSSDRSANGSVQITSNVASKEVHIEQNNSLSDTQNPDAKCNNSSENQYTDTNLDLSDKSRTNVQHKESDAYARKDTQETAVDHCKTFGDADSIEEEPNRSNREGMIPFDHVNDEISDTTTVTSALEAVDSNTTGMGYTEHVSDSVSTSNQESLSETSNLNVSEGHKRKEFDCSTTSLQQGIQSSRVNTDLELTSLLSVETSSTKPSSQTSVSDSFEEPREGHGESLSDELITNEPMNSSSPSLLADESYGSTHIDFPLDEKLENLFLDEVDKRVTSSENVGEDDTAFISALHNAEKGVTLDLGLSMESNLGKSYQFEELDSADAEKATYCPWLWTPMEIETATGNAECTFLEHPLPLTSTYTEAMDSSGIRDPNGEPLVTSYNRCFLGTVDYIWRSEGLQTTRVLAPIPKHAMEWTPGFPTKKWGSDHIALVSELAYVKDGIESRSNVK